MKKKAFTLTELLVVVVIVGVLAAVVLPKFRQVVENRKLTEAEGILTAVRNEQHARCLLDQKYTTQKSQLASMPANLGKNFKYTLKGTGMTAEPIKQDKKFTLQIGYADGTLCCQGSGCSTLSTDYPTCKPLPTDTGCAAPMVGEEEKVVVPEETCDKPETRDVKCSVVSEYGEGWEGTVHYILDEETCTYKEDINTCKQKLECDQDELITEKDCPQGCGKYAVTATCDPSTGKWIYDEEDTSSCKDAKTEERDCSEAEEGATGTQTRTQVCKDGQWTYDGVEWEGECETNQCKQIALEECGIENWPDSAKNGSVYDSRRGSGGQWLGYASKWQFCTRKNEGLQQQALGDAGLRRRYYWQFEELSKDGKVVGCQTFCRLSCGNGVDWSCWDPDRQWTRWTMKNEPQPVAPFYYDHNDRKVWLDGKDNGKYNDRSGYDKGECYISTGCPVGWESGGRNIQGECKLSKTCGHIPGPAKDVHVLRRPLSFEGPTNVQGHYWLNTRVIAVVGGAEASVGGCPVWRGATEVIDPIPTHIGDCHKELYGDMNNEENRRRMCWSLSSPDIQSGMCFEDIPLNMNPAAVGMTIQSRYDGKQVSEIVSCDPSQLQPGDIPFFVKQGSTTYALQYQLRRVASTTAVQCTKDPNCDYTTGY